MAKQETKEVKKYDINQFLRFVKVHKHTKFALEKSFKNSDVKTINEWAKAINSKFPNLEIQIIKE